MVNLGDVFPNFTAESTKGTIHLHEYLGDKWGILFSHPADYTPVCTTELGRVAKLTPEFSKRNCKVMAISCDTVEDHHGWIKDIQAYNNLDGNFPYPIIADEKRELAVQLGMIDPDEKTASGMPLTARAVFIIGPDKKTQAFYPLPCNNWTKLWWGFACSGFTSANSPQEGSNSCRLEAGRFLHGSAKYIKGAG